MLMGLKVVGDGRLFGVFYSNGRCLGCVFYNPTTGIGCERPDTTGSCTNNEYGSMIYKKLGVRKNA